MFTKLDLIRSLSNTFQLGRFTNGGTYNGEPLKWLIENIDLETDKCIIWPYGKSGGYPVVVFNSKSEKVCRLICEYKYGDSPKDMFGIKYVACHGPCHNTECINYKHLYWGTESKNMQDKKRDGTQYVPENFGKNNVGNQYTVGELNGQSKLKFENINEIIELYNKNIYIQKELAEIFNISQTQISRIINGKRWGGKDERRTHMKSLF